MARDLGTSMDFCRQNCSNSKVQWIFVDEKPWNIWGTYVRHMFSFAIKYGGVVVKKSLNWEVSGPPWAQSTPVWGGVFSQPETLGMVLVGCSLKGKTMKNIWMWVKTLYPQ
jgi:hypothetical protein